MMMAVLGRTRKQPLRTWNGVLDPSIGRARGHAGTGAACKDSKLKEAVQAHGDKDWGATASLVPGRVGNQCWDRWKKRIDLNRSTIRRQHAKGCGAKQYSGVEQDGP
jgi:hypothetical protein